MLNKPSWWLQSANWNDWLNQFSVDGHIPCAHPSCNRDATSVDHIIPRTSDHWAKDPLRAHEPSNLQPMCREHNSEKGIRPDNYWGQDFYFDQPVDLTKLRSSQSDFVYHPLFQYREHLAGRFSQVNGKLNCFLQCTGAGKTIGKAMVPFALNHGALAHFEDSGHRPSRCDRLLIVPITIDLRDQIALELGGRPRHMCRSGQQPIESQLVEFGIVNNAPRVKAIAGYDQLASAAHDFDHDIFVICSQSLWDSNNSVDMKRSVDEWVQAFSAFPVIIFDEFHRFTPKIREVISRANYSLCFGMSASPMSGLGKLLEDTTRITEYTYRDAALKDNSMKSLGAAVDQNPPPLHPTFEDIVSVIKTSEVLNLDGSTSSGVGHGNFAPMRSVGWAVVEQLRQTDNRRRDLSKVAGFRQHLRSEKVCKVVADLDYCGHAVIGAKSLHDAILLMDHLNAEFEKDRSSFPASKGWTASVTHSGRPKRGKVPALPPVPLDENHPWFRSLQLRKDGSPAPYVDKHCSRILIAVDKCKEGTNNNFCNVIGWARPYQSDISAIQRHGRGARSFHVLDEDGTLHVPPQELDTLFVITHEAYGNGSDVFEEAHAPLIRCLRFFADPHSYRTPDGKGLKDIPSFRSWLENEVDMDGTPGEDEEEILHGDETSQIVDYVARISSTGGPIVERDLLKHCKAENAKDRRKRLILNRADELLQKDEERISKTRRALGIDSVIDRGELLSLAISEKPDLRLQASKANPYMLNMSGGEHLEEMQAALATVKGEEYAEQVLTNYCVTNAPVYRGKAYFASEPPKLVHASVLDKANEITSILLRRFPTQLRGRHVELLRHATTGIRMKLGLSKNEPLEKGGKYDVSALFVELGERRHQRELMGHVLRQVMTPELEQVLSIDNQGEEANDNDF